MPTVRLLWIDVENARHEYEGEVEQSVMAAGEIAPNAASNFPGPAGTFRLLPEEAWRTWNGQDPAPVFLHESWQAHIEKWAQPIPELSHEAEAVTRARKAVEHQVDGRVAENPRSHTSWTVTRTEQTPQGLAVVGRCVVLRPTAV